MESKIREMASRSERMISRNDYQSFIRSSASAYAANGGSPAATGRQVRYGDRIFVRLVNVRRGWQTIADFEMRDAVDMSDIYGELRRRAAGSHGLMRLYVRNASRGWSFEQPFMLYAPARVAASAPAVSVTRPMIQPAQPSRRAVPESVRLLFQH